MSFSAGAASARGFARAAAGGAQAPVMLPCAVSGGLVTGKPHQPATREDVISEAVGAAKAGASILHIHGRTPAGQTACAVDDYLAIKLAIREQIDDIVL